MDRKITEAIHITFIVQLLGSFMQVVVHFSLFIVTLLFNTSTMNLSVDTVPAWLKDGRQTQGMFVSNKSVEMGLYDAGGDDKLWIEFAWHYCFPSFSSSFLLYGLCSLSHSNFHFLILILPVFLPSFIAPSPIYYSASKQLVLHICVAFCVFFAWRSSKHCNPKFCWLWGRNGSSSSLEPFYIKGRYWDAIFCTQQKWHCYFDKDLCH